jgi:chemotaxis protein MotA
MDIGTIIGLVIGVVSIIGGFMMEGGHIGAIMQPTAALIVFGGTWAAVIVQFPLNHVGKAFADLKKSIMPPKVDLMHVVEEMVQFAQRARKEGVVALEGDAESAKDPFLAKALRLAVDGSEARVIRESMEVEMERVEAEDDVGPKVFEAAGGYAPTIGILGAVLGLIHVMQNLSDPSKLGAGIAVAFVATVYALFSANVLYLPLSGRIKLRCKAAHKEHELVLTGVIAIVEGENPRIIEDKLKGFVGKVKGKAGEPEAAKKAA